MLWTLKKGAFLAQHKVMKVASQVLPFPIPVLLTGFSAAADPVPAGLLPAQRPGCTVWLKPEFATPMATDPHRPGQFVSHVTLRVPNHPVVLGATWFHQWIVASVTCTGSGSPCPLDAIGSSDAARLSVGL